MGRSFKGRVSLKIRKVFKNLGRMKKGISNFVESILQKDFKGCQPLFEETEERSFEQLNSGDDTSDKEKPSKIKKKSVIQGKSRKLIWRRSSKRVLLLNSVLGNESLALEDKSKEKSDSYCKLYSKEDCTGKGGSSNTSDENRNGKKEESFAGIKPENDGSSKNVSFMTNLGSQDILSSKKRYEVRDNKSNKSKYGNGTINRMMQLMKKVDNSLNAKELLSELSKTSSSKLKSMKILEKEINDLNDLLCEQFITLDKKLKTVTPQKTFRKIHEDLKYITNLVKIIALIEKIYNSTCHQEYSDVVLKLNEMKISNQLELSLNKIICSLLEKIEKIGAKEFVKIIKNRDQYSRFLSILGQSRGVAINILIRCRGIALMDLQTQSMDNINKEREEIIERIDELTKVFEAKIIRCEHDDQKEHVHYSYDDKGLFHGIFTELGHLVHCKILDLRSKKAAIKEQESSMKKNHKNTISNFLNDNKNSKKIHKYRNNFIISILMFCSIGAFIDLTQRNFLGTENKLISKIFVGIMIVSFFIFLVENYYYSLYGSKDSSEYVPKDKPIVAVDHMKGDQVSAVVTSVVAKPISVLQDRLFTA